MKQTKQTMGITALLMGILFVLPLVVFRAEYGEMSRPEVPTEPLTEEIPFVSGEEDGKTMLRVLHGDQVVEMDLGTYLTCVVRAEMPASFEQEALCAQAVAARTYTRYKLSGGSNHKDVGADICTDSTCCQAYMTEEAARLNWGADADENERKIEEAVTRTDGQVVLYDSQPILAVFHSSSAGQTRRAGDVWQNDLPYLQPVSSPEPAENIPNYYSRVEFTAEEFKARVKKTCPQADLSGDIKTWLQHAVTDSAGSVHTVEIGGVKVKGASIRTMLGLRSACFEWQVEGDRLVFYVTGYGHGVGLSQYGANRMAQEGATYSEILTHYYTGVSVGVWKKEA